MAHHPGTTLQEQYLKPSGLSQNRLARVLGVPPRRINEIILGKRAITADTAVRLGTYFGNSASYWLGLQAEYDIELARTRIGAALNRIQARGEGVTAGSTSGQARTARAPSLRNAERNIKRRLMR